VLNEAVKTRNAFSMGTPTVVAPLMAGIVDVSLMTAPDLQVGGGRLGGLLKSPERLIPDAVQVGAQGTHSIRVELIDPARAFRPADNKPTILEHTKVLGHRRPADRELFGKFPN
jgi:hypothetical protein